MHMPERTEHTSRRISDGAVVLLVLETRRAYQLAMALAREVLPMDVGVRVQWEEATLEPTGRTKHALRSKRMRPTIG